MVVAWPDRTLSSARLMRNWGIVYIDNFIGAILVAFLVIPMAMFSGTIPYDLAGFFENLAVVSIGNVLGGGLFGAAACWAEYQRTK